MNFSFLPTESDPGPMFVVSDSELRLATSAAWNMLVVELSMIAVGYQFLNPKQISGSWLTQALESMLDAVMRYAAWLHSTAALVEKVTAQSKALALVGEAAGSTVHPSVIVANRKLRRSMVLANALAQCAPAIADIDAHYEAMWGQDADARYRHAAASAVAAKLQPFTRPPVVANLTSRVAPDEAMAQSPAAPPTAGMHLHEIVSAGPRMTSAVFPVLSVLASPALTDLSPSSEQLSPSESDFSSRPGRPSSSSGVASELRSAETWGLIDRPVSVSIGRAGALGGLSVPPNWSAAATPVDPALPDSGRDCDLAPIASAVGSGGGSTGSCEWAILRPKVVPCCLRGG